MTAQMNAQLQKIVNEFTTNLAAEIQRQKEGQIESLVRGFTFRGTLPKVGKGHGRRKGPIQLCPVPKCKKRAAPVFHMVCADHKDLPKAKIAKHREARRRAKLTAARRSGGKKREQWDRSMARSYARANDE